MIYACCDERRLQAVAEGGVLNGVAYLEVSDSEAPTEALRQRTLFVRLLLPPPSGPQQLAPANVSISGGERIPVVAVEWVAPATALPAGEDPDLVAGLDDPATVLVVRTESRGDFSTYRLRLVASAIDANPPAGFDQLLAHVDFSFKVECPADFDCRVEELCALEPASGPAIDYLAKDFSTFRRLMLDRLSLTTPGWDERNVAELGVALVEVLAYVADELSYRQDAVATEAYLATARRRPSLRRLARLVDYAVHEGSNARACIRTFVAGEDVALPDGLQFLTKVEGVDAVLEPAERGAERGAGVRRRSVRAGRRAADTAAARQPGSARLLHLGRHRLLPSAGSDGGHVARPPRGEVGAGPPPRLRRGRQSHNRAIGTTLTPPAGSLCGSRR